MFCTNCGKKVPNESKFCPSCGLPVVEDKEKEPTQEEITTAEHSAESKVVDIHTETEQGIPQKESILVKGMTFILGIAIIAGIAYFVNIKTGYNIITGVSQEIRTNFEGLAATTASALVRDELSLENLEYADPASITVTKIRPCHQILHSRHFPIDGGTPRYCGSASSFEWHIQGSPLSIASPVLSMTPYSHKSYLAYSGV